MPKTTKIMPLYKEGERDNLDRHWRNARTHTLHDPVDYKLRDLGRFFLDGRIPDPTAYS